MVEQLGYPSSLIAVEASIVVGEAKKRCDAVIYDRQMQPQLLIECKAETVPLTQKTLDQAVTYNRRLNVPYLLLHNGVQSVFVDLTQENLHFSDTIPPYKP